MDLHRKSLKIPDPSHADHHGDWDNCAEKGRNRANPAGNLHPEEVDEGCCPESDEDRTDHVSFILGQRRVDKVGKSSGDKSKRCGVPNYVFNPLEPYG